MSTHWKNFALLFRVQQNTSENVRQMHGASQKTHNPVECDPDSFSLPSNRKTQEKTILMRTFKTDDTYGQIT